MPESCEVPQDNPDDQEISRILEEHSVVAVVGLSPKPSRDSFQVARYLQDNGYTIIPVNPNYDEVLGHISYARLEDVPGRIGIVDIFRRPEAVPEIVDSAIRANAKVVWMQLGVISNEAARKARARGLRVVMNRCMKVEHMRLAKGLPG